MLRNIFILFFTTVFVVGVVIGGLWFMDWFGPARERTLTVGTLSQLVQTANIQRARMGTYAGTCREVGVPETYSCRDSDDGILILGRISSGTYYCGDSTGFVGVVDIAPRTGVSCRP